MKNKLLIIFIFIIVIAHVILFLKYQKQSSEAPITNQLAPVSKQP